MQISHAVGDNYCRASSKDHALDLLELLLFVALYILDLINENQYG